MCVVFGGRGVPHGLKMMVIAVRLVEFMYLVFTCVPDESYGRQLRSLLLHICFMFFEHQLTPLCVDGN